MKLEIQKIRERIARELTTRYHHANAQAADPYWRAGRHTPKQWVASAFGVARNLVVSMPAEPGEPSRAFFDRLRAELASYRDAGPDADDEAWWSSAIDEACMLVTSIAAEVIATGPSSQVGTDSGPIG